MLSRKFFEFSTKPLSFINPFRGTLWSSFSTSSIFQEKESLKENEKGNSQNQSKEKNEKQNDERDHYYNNRSRFTYTSALLPLLAYMGSKISEVSCLFKSDKPDRNKMKNRVSLIQYPANNPIEDRWSCQQLESIDGYVAIVLDGHGGWQVAEFAQENLAKEIDRCLAENKNKKFENEDEYITTSIKEAFDGVENKFLAIAREAYKIGFAGTGQVGACCLAAVIHNNKLYAANIGDCKGVICTNENNQITLRKINHKLNANSKKEQARLKAMFKDHDIFVCRKGDNKACYVKNSLQPTRAFGDFRLKYPEFNNPKNLPIEYGYRRPLETFNGPYITHVPDIKVIDLNKNDKYLILSSDGMWDELNKEDVEVARIVKSKLGDKAQLTQELLDASLRHAAKEAAMSEAELRTIPVGMRRRYHDDLTIIILDLENQVKL